MQEGPEGKMNSSEEHNEPCGCGSGKKHKDCCGAPQGEVTTMRVKDINSFELTPGLPNALSATLDGSYQQYFIAAVSGASTKEAERGIAALPEGKRYLTRVLDSLDSAFADFDTETAVLDLPHMQNRKPEAIKSYLEFRLRLQFSGEVGAFCGDMHGLARFFS
jgi:SEC-C motif